MTALVVVAAIATASAPTMAATTSSPWSQTDADASLSRSNPHETVLTPSTIAKARWLRAITASPSQPGDLDCSTGLISNPILAGGAAYAVVSGKLERINAKTGVTVWQTTPDTSFTTQYESLAISSTGLVVLAGLDCTSMSDPVGTIQAYQASNGAKVWSANMPNNGPLHNMVLSQGYAIAAGTSPGGGRVVAAYKLSTGQSVWSHSVDPTCSIYDEMLVAAGEVVLPTCTAAGDSQLAAYALATGAAAWTRAGTWKVVAADSDKATVGHHLYAISSAGSVNDLNPKTGATRFTLTEAVRPLAVDAGQRVYATCGANGTHLCAYATGTGALQWNIPYGASVSLVASADGLLYLDDGSVLAESTGTQVTQLWSGRARALAVGDGRVAVVDDLRILDLYGLAGY